MLVSTFKPKVFGPGLLCIDYSYQENVTKYPDCNSWTWNTATRLMEGEAPVSYQVLK